MPGKSDSSDNTDQPDWLDELYQQNEGDEPGAELDARIRNAARDAVRSSSRSTPWYLRTRTLASAATIVLAAGVVMMWSGNPDLHQAGAPSQTSLPMQAPATVADAPSPSAPATEPLDQPKPAMKARLVAEAEEDALPQARLEEHAGVIEELEAARQQLDYDSQRFADASAARPTSSTPATETLGDSSMREVRAVGPSFLTRERPEIALPSGLLSQQCESAGLIDVGAAAPYGMCRQPEQTSIHHADCPTPYLLDGETVAVDRDSQSLLLTADAASWKLVCNEDGWQRTQLMPESTSNSQGNEKPAPELEQ
jgi:hypothetical protein